MLSDRFRWVYCQLEVLRQCFPSSVRGVLAELPESLDETYERILQQIPKPNRVHAHRLLQCLVVAARPLSTDELAEVLAIDFSGTGMTPMMDDKLRWEDKEQAVLSACSSLIAIVQDRDSRLVQFSHFSVKEFLTSNRLAASTVDTLRYHHIRLEAAHVMMVQVCLSVLLRLENHMYKRTIWSYPLSKYAGEHFGNHVEFESVLSSIGDGVDKLLDKDKPHFYTWVWLQIGDWRSEDWHNSRIESDMITPQASPNIQNHDTKPKHPPPLPPLYYIAGLGHLCLARHLIQKYSQDLIVRDDKGCNPLHIAVLAGMEGVSQLLIEHSVDLDIQDLNGRTPLHMAAYMGLAEATRMLLECGEPFKARLDARDKNRRTPLHLASKRGRSGIARLLLRFGADVGAPDNDSMTPLHLVSQCDWGDDPQMTKTAQLLLEHGASVHVQDKNGQVPLHAASHGGLSGVVALLLKFGADVDAPDNDSMTPLHLVSQRHWGDAPEWTKTAQLLLEHGASVHVRDKNGQVPLHAALPRGASDIAALLLKFGADVDAPDNDSMTPLHLVSQHHWNYFQITKTTQLLLEHGASVHVRDKNGQVPLHAASRRGPSGIAALLLKFGADVDAPDNDSMTPLHLVSQPHRGDYTEMTKTAQLLLEHGASVHVRDKNGQVPLHLASQHGLSGTVELLLKFRADVDAQDTSNMTPLHLSVSSIIQRKNSEIYGFDYPDLWSVIRTIGLLLEHGANLQMQDDKGETPFQVALRSGEQEVIDALLSGHVKNNPNDVDNIIASVPHETTYQSTESSSPFLLRFAILYPTVKQHLSDSCR